MASENHLKPSLAFIVYPAIDLRDGKVVRLRTGDPAQQTVYGDDPAAQARRWLESGARWLHVVNLDGAFGESSPRKGHTPNQAALTGILEAALAAQAQVQFGGGLRTLQDITVAVEAGVNRVLLGTAAVENPEMVAEALQRYGPATIGAALDARQGKVQVQGWTEATTISAVELGHRLFQQGLRTVIYTNIARDGMGSGADIEAARELALTTGLSVIASGGVRSLEDIRLARQAGLAGIIVGRALYDGTLDLREVLLPKETLDC